MIERRRGPAAPRLVVVQEGALHVHSGTTCWSARAGQGVLVDTLRVQRWAVEPVTRLAEFALPARLSFGADDPPARVVSATLADQLQFMARELARCTTAPLSEPLAKVLLRRWVEMMEAALG